MIVLAGVLWGVTGLFVNALDGRGFTSMQLVACRAVITTVLMLVTLLITDRRLLKVKLRDMWCFVGTGIISIVMFSYCYFRTMMRTSVSVAAVLLYTAPIMVIIMSAVLFKERINLQKGICCAMAFVGCILTTGALTGGVNLPADGIVTGLLSGFGYALYSIFSRIALNKGYNSLTIIFYTFLCANFGVLPFVNVVDTAQKAFCTDIATALMIVAMAIVTTFLPYLLYTGGLTSVEAGKASIMASVEPVVASVCSVVLLAVPMRANEAAGALLVLGAVVSVNIKVVRKNAEQ